MSDDKSIVVRRAVAARSNCPAQILKRYLNEPDVILLNNTLRSITRKHPEFTFEELVSKEIIESSYTLLNAYLNEKSDFLTFGKKDSNTVAEIERANIVAQYSDNPMIQVRIVNDLSEIPECFSLRWKLLKALSDNLHLTKSITKKKR